MRKINFMLLFLAVASLTVSVLLAKTLVKKSPALILSERSLTDTALSFFRDDIQKLTATQIRLQQQEINTRLLKLSEQDAQTRAKIEAIPFWLAAWRIVFYSLLIVGCFVIVSTTCSACLIFVRRKSLVSQTFGASVVTLPYGQINKETGTIRVLQTALTQISQGTLDKEDLFRLFQVTRGNHGAASQRMIDVTPPQVALTEGRQQVVSIPFQEAVKSFQPGQILTGFDADQKPIFFPVKGFVSAAVGGESGSGKTSKLRFLLAQLICTGVFVSILDAHEGTEESLVSSLGSLARFPNVRIFHPFDTREAVDAMLSEVQAIIDAQSPASPARVYVLDELRPLNHACERVEYLMDKLANEGRKFNLFGVFSSQTWEASLFKQSGSAARDACVLKVAARMPKDQARILFKDNDAARKVAKLTTPEMYVSSVRYSGVVNVPFASTTDMELLALEYLGKRERVVNGEYPIENNAPFDPGRDKKQNPIDGKGSNVVTSEVTETFDTLDDISESSELSKKIRAYMETNEITLSKFAEACSVNKGLLSCLLQKGEPLSKNMEQKVTDYLTRNNRLVTPSNIVKFPGGEAI